jgi:hypothetical protein
MRGARHSLSAHLLCSCGLAFGGMPFSSSFCTLFSSFFTYASNKLPETNKGKIPSNIE